MTINKINKASACKFATITCYILFLIFIAIYDFFWCVIEISLTFSGKPDEYYYIFGDLLILLILIRSITLVHNAYVIMNNKIKKHDHIV
jgi:hypothetical protein